MKSNRILVVDEENFVVNILDFTLRLEGYDVVKAQTADDAIRQIINKRFALVVCGENDNGAMIDGFDLCRRVRNCRSTRKLPFLLLIPARKRYDHQAAERLHVNAVVTKPFSVRAVVQAVHEVLHEGAARS